MNLLQLLLGSARRRRLTLVCAVEGPSPGDGHTLGVAVLRADGLLQLVQLARLLQLLHQALDGLFAPLLLLPSSILLPNSSDSSPCSSAPRWGLLPAQKTLHDRRSERKDGGHGGVRVCVMAAAKATTQSLYVDRLNMWTGNEVTVEASVMELLGQHQEQVEEHQRTPEKEER